jgi:GR25 family glycosyltransferase involved in LPS biosynthesis
VINAVDASKNIFTKKMLRHMSVGFNGKKQLTSGEYACAKSHARALKSFIASSSNDFCLILEDDVLLKLSPSFIKHQIEKIAMTKSNNNFILHLGGMEGMKFEYYFKFREKLTKGNLRLVETKVLYRACAYLVTRESAQKFHKFLSYELANIADNWSGLKKSENLDIYNINLFTHPRDLSQSSLEAERNE